MALVSVLLPNYNNALYLTDCLTSLCNQTFKDFDVFFIDDCSKDNSISIAETFTMLDLKIIRKDANTGIVDTMNEGLKRISSKYIVRMDGDDISTPERFQMLVDFMETHPEIGVCSSDIETFGATKEKWIFERDPKMNQAKLIFGHGIGHASSIFRTKVLKENCIQYVDKFWRLEDYYLFYSLKKLTLTTSIPGFYYRYRIENYNNNPEIWEKKKIAYKRFYEMIFSDLKLPIDEKALEIHLQLNGLTPVTYNLKEYQRHRLALISSNEASGVFPKNELQRVLDQALTKTCFKLIALKKVSFFNLISYFAKDKSLFRYYLSVRWFGRGK